MTEGNRWTQAHLFNLVPEGIGEVASFRRARRWPLGYIMYVTYICVCVLFSEPQGSFPKEVK